MILKRNYHRTRQEKKAATLPLRISQREIEGHLPYVEKSIKAKGGKFIVTQPFCFACQYKFNDRKKKTKPSKCPKCNCEMINPPTFEIVFPSKRVKK